MTALELPRPTIDAIEAAVVAQRAADKPRAYLGASVIGKPCERALWYAFRWAQAPKAIDGRMLRLFDTGHVEEGRLIAWLRLTGADVQEVDPATGDQWKVEAVDGHFGGHMDGVANGILEAPKTAHVVEAKTHNEKSFRQLEKDGVGVAKPEHMAQMQIYMHLGGYSRALYIAKNKNDDALYVERVNYDAAHANALMVKAERIIRAASAPPRIADNPDAFACRFCDWRDLCHHGAWPVRNCRTCLHADPGSNGPQWHCHRHGRALTVEDQRAGCPNHLFNPSLVPGEQVDADETNETVTYALPDGTEWVDGARAVAS
jgi:hypothetical protein